LPEKFLTVPEKTAMRTCKITLPDSPHPVIISKNPGFRALHLARQNEFRFFSFNKYKKIFFPFLVVGFCPKNLAFCVFIFHSELSFSEQFQSYKCRLQNKSATSSLTIYRVVQKKQKVQFDGFYCRARLCDSKSSVRLSVRL